MLFIYQKPNCHEAFFTLAVRSSLSLLAVTLVWLSQLCAPLWAHRIGWKNHHIFPIGRCQLVPPGSDTLSPLTKNVNEYLGNVFMDGHMVLGFLKGFSLFGFSAASDGVSITMITVMVSKMGGITLVMG